MALEIAVTELPEPALEFGHGIENRDPKSGLLAGGPFSLRYPSAQPPAARLGFVGPAEVIDVARNWFARCERRLLSEKKNRHRFPDFPGFNSVFRTPLEMEQRWQFEIPPLELARALKGVGKSRFRQVLEMYADGVATLARREMGPNVVLCAVSDEILDSCFSISADGVTAASRRPLNRDQLSLNLELQGAADLEEEPKFRTFRRALKAKVMLQRDRAPIQIGTNHLFLDADDRDDPATRAWSVAVALYYKAGGIPWRLAEVPAHVCFVGLSFHRLATNLREVAYASLAQAFSSDIEGFVLRGERVPRREDRQLHLTEGQAFDLGKRILAEYQGRAGRLPVRMTMHKTSSFDAAERVGFSAAFSDIPETELLTLSLSEYRLFTNTDYPPSRGTLCTINSATRFLYTTGFYRDWGTYPGPHVPAPLRIEMDGLKAEGLRRVSEEILGLTKMNWNSASPMGRDPITLHMAREVGPIMAEVPENEEPEKSYRYYM